MPDSELSLFRIVLLPGDGVGPEIMAQARNILDIIQAELPVCFDIDTIDCGGAYYLTHGLEWPADAIDRCKLSHAVLLGAVGHVACGKPVFTRPGHPYPDARLAGYGPVIGTRKRLELFANVRPVKKLAGVRTGIMNQMTDAWAQKGFDFVIVRENTEDAYAGNTLKTRGKTVTAIEITKTATRRIARFAFDLARKRHIKQRGNQRVTCVDKSNIIAAHAYFRKQVTEVGRDYPDICLDYAYADSFCLSQLQHPDQYDVVVCPNFVGDIVSDAAALMIGGLGMAPSANLGTANAMFEPVHGSAPDLAGSDRVNPCGILLSMGMMFDWLAELKDAHLLRPLSGLLTGAMESCFKRGMFTDDLTPDTGIGTRAMGEAIAGEFRDALVQWKEKNIE